MNWFFEMCTQPPEGGTTINLPELRGAACSILVSDLNARFACDSMVLLYLVHKKIYIVIFSVNKSGVFRPAGGDKPRNIVQISKVPASLNRLGVPALHHLYGFRYVPGITSAVTMLSASRNSGISYRDRLRVGRNTLAIGTIIRRLVLLMSNR